MLKMKIPLYVLIILSVILFGFLITLLSYGPGIMKSDDN